MVFNSRIAGKHLTPLPYESALCSLWRLGWRNTLNSAQLKGLCSKKTGYSTKDCTKNLDWIDDEKFRSASGWQLPSIHERRFVDSIRGDNEIWITSTLRYCPLCLELGYHSFLQQLIGLQICPLHRVPLVTHCQVCGEKMPNFRHSPAVYDHPYFCRCGHPYSGIAPSLLLDDFLRAHLLQIEQEFGAIMNWWERSTNIRDLNARFWSPKAAAANNMGNWCDVNAFIRSLSINDLPVSDCFYSPQFKKTIKLNWKIRCAKETGQLYSWLPKRDWQKRIQTPNAVYRLLLRRIQRWIIREEKLSQADFEKSLTIHSKEIRDFNPKILALLCFRTEFEDRFWEGKPWNPQSAQLKDEPAIDIIKYANRTPRQGWLAVFLGLFASWYFRILKARNQSLTQIGFYHKGESAHILFWNELKEQVDGHWWSGSVAFPFLEDLQSLCNQGLKIQHDSPISVKHPSKLLDTSNTFIDLPNRCANLSIADEMNFNDFDESIKSYIDSLTDIVANATDREKEVSIRNDRNTRRSYQFELERYLCWCLVQYNKQPKQITAHEFKEYPSFLVNPEPLAFWMGEEGRKLFGTRWHPFRDKLSTLSTRRALRVVNGFYRFLSDRGLVSRELKILIPSMPVGDWSVNTGRGLSQGAWDFIHTRMNELPNSIKDIRLVFTIRMLYNTGLHISELVRARTSDLCVLPVSSAKNLNNKWHLKVYKINGKARNVELCDDLVSLLWTYLLHRGYSGKLENFIAEGIPLLSPLLETISPLEIESPRKTALVSEASIRTQVKTFFVKCATELSHSNPRIAAELNVVSPGHLRNAHILSAFSSGTSLPDMGTRVGLSGLDRVDGFNKSDVWSSPKEIDIFLEMKKFFDLVKLKN